MLIGYNKELGQFFSVRARCRDTINYLTCCNKSQELKDM